MTEYKNLKIDKSKDVIKIFLDRPKNNVLNIEMIKEFNLVLEKIHLDKDLKCVVISGKGKKFCAGVEVSDHKPKMVREMIPVFNRIFELINVVEIPVIAAVNGICLGGGMELAIACDIVIASEKAKFGQPEVKLGFFPPYAAFRLPELVGQAKAIEICTTGKIYTSKQSKCMGFVSETASIDDFDNAVEKTIKEICMSSPLILKMNKIAVKKHMGMKFFKAINLLGGYFLNTLMETQDTLIGIKSFEEKTIPQWKNK